MNEQEIIQNSAFGAEHREDPRDIQLASFTMYKDIPTKYITDMSPFPVLYQRQIGACVAHALATTLEVVYFQKENMVIDLSPRFPYAITKNMDGIGEQGTIPRQVVGNVEKQGISTQTTLPNDTTLPYADYINLNAISAVCYEEAKLIMQKLGVGYAFAPLTQEGITQAIYDNKAVMCLMRVGNTYWTAPDGTITWDKDKILPIKRPKEITSGHEIVLYGYEVLDAGTKIYFRNHWSDQWADGGNGWFWLDEHLDLINEVLVITEVPQALIDQAKSATFSIQVQYGDNNEEVKRIQAFLMSKGYSIPAGATGYYGEQTRQAVMKLQYTNGIYFNMGRNIGKQTLAILNKL